MNRRVLLVGLAITIPAIILFVVSLGRDPHKVRSPLVGRVAPDFTLLEAGSGAVVRLSSLRGKPVVLNFWATWCVPCFAEHGVLTEASRQLGPNVQFLGVVYDDKEEKILQFLKENGSAYPTLNDGGGKTAIAYGVYGVPETFFIDPSGKIVAKYEGPLTPQLLDSNLQKAAGRS
ncbi:MAG TPA: redoxin domain-containing protein [Thermoanaerobaculia bacterium]|nr:redoxin domain-containing protein [Thermoanaerobaculia bacterium]